MVAIILALIVLLIVLGVLFNVKWLLNLRMFITTIILCMLITILNLLTMTLYYTYNNHDYYYDWFTSKTQPSFLLTKRSKFLSKMTKYLILGVLLHRFLHILALCLFL